VLDEQGGPNHVGNYCDAPIIADTEKQELRYNSSYYAIKHFSKHVQVGAKRVASTVNNDALNHVVFENPDKSIVVVIQNETEEDQKITIETPKKHSYHTKINKRSISTIIFEV
uniref:glycoside hydrolase family 30 protein n=1 Tax=Methanocalculus natronophilus TaxID=1262400 RepID=UPI0031B63195